MGSRRNRPYHDETWLREQAKKYTDDSGRIHYTDLLRDNNISTSEVSSLVHHLEKFKIHITPSAQLKYEQDEKRRQELEKIREEKRIRRSKEGMSILINNVSFDTVEEIKKVKGEKSYHDYFIDLHKTNLSQNLTV